MTLEECLVFSKKVYLFFGYVRWEHTVPWLFLTKEAGRWNCLPSASVTLLISASAPHPRQRGVLQTRGINLSCIRTCVVVAEERPRVALQQSFSKLFKDIGLSPRAVSTTFGSRVNVAICLQVTPMISFLCGGLRAQAAAYPLFIWAPLCLTLPIGKMKMIVLSFTRLS